MQEAREILGPRTDGQVIAGHEGGCGVGGYQHPLMDRQNPGGIANAEQDIRRQVAPPARQARRRGGAGRQGRDIHAKTPEIGRLCCAMASSRKIMVEG